MKRARKSLIGSLALGLCLIISISTQCSSASEFQAINSVDFPDKISCGLDRPSRVSLDGQWQFQTDPQDIGEKEKWFEGGKIKARSVLVPLPWELAAEDLRRYSGVAWYERALDVPSD